MLFPMSLSGSMVKNPVVGIGIVLVGSLFSDKADGPLLYLLWSMQVHPKRCGITCWYPPLLLGLRIINHFSRPCMQVVAMLAANGGPDLPGAHFVLRSHPTQKCVSI